MKIITQNLEFLFDAGVHRHSGKDWEYTQDFVQSRIEYFANYFKKEDADIVFLQEVASKRVINEIIKMSEINYSYFIADTDENGVGNCILLKSKIFEASSITPVSDIPVFVSGDVDIIGPRIPPRRDFAYIKTSYNGEPLFLLNIHLKSNFVIPEKMTTGESVEINTQVKYADGIIRSELFRASQAKQARKIIDSFFNNNPNAQVIVAGDFNTEHSNPIFRIIQGGLKNLPDSLFAVSKLIPEKDKFSILINNEKYMPDNILLSKNLVNNIKSVTVQNSSIPSSKNEYPKPEIILSDHAPLILELN